MKRISVEPIHIFAAVILWVCLLLTPSARATEGQETRLPVLDKNASLADYLQYAALNNPGLQAAWLRWKAALEKVPQAQALPDPRFNYRYYIQRVETRVGPQRQAAGLAQRFPWFGKLKLQGNVAMEAANVAKQGYETERLKLSYRVKRAYYEYYYLSRSIAVVRENRKLLERLEEVARTKYKAGVAQHADVIRAQVELGKLDDRLNTLTDLRKPFASQLNAALDRPLDAEIPWPVTIAEERLADSNSVILLRLPEANPQLIGMEHEIRKQRQATDLAEKAYYPDITLGVDYIDTAGARMGGLSRSGRDPVIGMVSINIPIWRGRYAAQTREAKTRHRAASRSKRELENTLTSRARMVLYRLRDAERKIDLYRDTLLPKAKQSLKVTETSFRTGKATFLELVDAQRMLLDFQLSHERALTDHTQRIAEMEMLVGNELPRARAVPASEKGEL